MFDPTHVEDFIEFLLSAGLFQEAAERFAGVLNDDGFSSVKGKTRHRLWLELSGLLTKCAEEISRLDVDTIIRGGIKKFTDEVQMIYLQLFLFISIQIT
jgi:pre-mRNA-splicing factor SYF1